MARFFLLFFIFTSCALPAVELNSALARANPFRKRCYNKRHHKRAHPNHQVRIVIDPGHGGEDYGTYSRIKPRQHEKYLTLSTAYMLRDHLQNMGYHVLMTRHKDENVSLQERVDFAEEQNASFFISLHYNSAPSDQAHGIEVFYYKAKDNLNRMHASKHLAEKILHESVKNTHAKSRGVKHGNFKVIRETEMPAILVEGGFLTNKGELEKLKDPAYLNTIAQSVAIGIDQHVHSR